MVRSFDVGEKQYENVEILISVSSISMSTNNVTAITSMGWALIRCQSQRFIITMNDLRCVTSCVLLLIFDADDSQLYSSCRPGSCV